jgi:glycosyltransferase involved in cell wall biosynthesis
MKVLLTSILCQSGLMTHVHDLLQYLRRHSIPAAAAFRKSDYATPEEAAALKERLAGVEIWEYGEDEELLEIAEAAQCDLLHAHSYLTLNAACAASRRLGIPFIITLHSVYLWGLAYAEPLVQAERIIAVGPAQARFVGPWRKKMVIIPNGIDLDVFRPGTDEEGGEGDEITVLWYGRVNGRLSRGLRSLDEAAPKLPSFVQVKAVGQADIQLKNIPQVGWVEDPVRELQASHIAFAHGRSLREAMACGSIGMLLGHGYGGMVTRERLKALDYAVDALPQYHLPRATPEVLLRDVLNVVNSGKLAELRAEARSIAEEFFDLEDMGRRTLDVYAAALS